MKKVLSLVCLLVISTGVVSAHTNTKNNYSLSPMCQLEVQRKINEETFNNYEKNKKFNEYVELKQNQNQIKYDKSVKSKYHRNSRPNIYDKK